MDRKNASGGQRAINKRNYVLGSPGGAAARSRTSWQTKRASQLAGGASPRGRFASAIGETPVRTGQRGATLRAAASRVGRFSGRTDWTDRCDFRQAGTTRYFSDRYASIGGACPSDRDGDREKTWLRTRRS